MPEGNTVSFLADENFDLNIVRLLRQEGFIVHSIAEMAPSVADPQVLAIAVERSAVILTEDKDFGELVHRLRLPHRGVLLVRPVKMNPSDKAIRVLNIVRQHMTQLPNAFAVLSNDNFRIKTSAEH